ncbi:ESPR-type extended signal peptide-containing protein [Stenotrophomonas maltophilia group sp. msm4]|uniref:ESPR-type extended signal peptide-containing protein n=1 Tax=Stenotrophomonas maltophilia group TaxID=995085 RepID=UPI00092EB414|nr:MULTISPECIES: ESPR-type extended signal peptide-containing protein [Stenotrophomonas maltophilia group]MDT3492355.1 ESPR-type extended signal peptide-containing protein [Stenotrophomonas maltophilia group sp. msm4]
MNRIYRRIWNAARQCWVVASELAVARQCSSSPRRLRLLVIPLSMSAAGSISANAGSMYWGCSPFDWDKADVYCVPMSGQSEDGRTSANAKISTSKDYLIMGGGSYNDGSWNAAFGPKAQIIGNYNAALGHKANINGVDSVAVGYNATANGGHSTVVGANAYGRGIGSTAFGNSAAATRQNALAVGSGSLSQGENAVAMGANAFANGVDGVALGSKASVDTGGGTSGIAIGAAAKAGTAGYTGAIAIGGGAEARIDSVALGYGASAAAQGAVALGVRSSATEKNTVSVGSSTLRRRIVNVEDGRITASSSDAVTGKQLHAMNERVDGLIKQDSASGIVRIANSNTGTEVSMRNAVLATRKVSGVSDGTLTTSSTDAVNGRQLNATNSRLGTVESAVGTVKGDLADVRTLAQSATNRIDATTLALGKGAVAESGSYGISTAIGNNAKAYNGRSVALGFDALAGVDAEGNKVNNQNAGVSIGANTRSANGAVATGFRAIASGNFSIAVGGDANAAAEHATAMGYLSKATAQRSTALGNLAVSANTSAVALGDRANARHDNAVALGAGSVTASVNSVSVGSAATKRKIQYIADGAVSNGSTDAITGNQLFATNQAVSTAQNTATSAQTAANDAKVDAAKALTETAALAGLVSETAASGNVRLGEKNSGTVLDVRNSTNASRKVAGVADGDLGDSSNEAVNGRQLNATNVQVATVEKAATAAQADATVAKADAAKALVSTTALEGLVSQTAGNGDVRLGEKNSGTVLDVRNSMGVDRKISGVADGMVTDSSADAVSGRQLFATNARVSMIERQSKFVGLGTDEFSERAVAGGFGVAIGDSAKASPLSEGGTAIGAFANSLGMNSVAIGRGSLVTEHSERGFALGVASRVEAAGGMAIGAGAKVSVGATGSVSIGSGSEATESGTASFGNSLTKRRLVNVDRGTADHNATTVSQLKDSLATLGGSAGMDANGNIIAPTYSVQGGAQNTVEDALMALDGAVITSSRRADKVEGQLNSIFQDSPSARGDGMNQIALNGVNGMVLTNLADGRIAPGSRDAVTGNQLYAAEQKISQNRNDLEAMRKEREMREQAMRGLDASGPIDFGGARLTGVAEAKLSADSSDVVRGSQLYETNSRVSELEDVAQFVSIGSAPFSERAQAGVAGVALGNSAKTGLEGGTAVGTFAEAMGKNSTAIGRAATVSVDSANGFAMGVGAQVGGGAGGANEGIAIGAAARVEGGAHGSLALGNGALADEEGVASFGGVGIKRRLVNIASGTANHNAATVGQLRDALSALGSEVDANGNIVGPSFTVQGQSQSTLNGALEALDGAVVSTTSRVNQVESQLRNVFQDTPSVRADGLNQLTLAGTHGMVISNVANGLVAAGSRDAVNGGQLHSMQQQLNGRMDGLEQRIDAPQPQAMAVASVPEPEAPVPQAEGGQQVASVGEGEKPAPQPKTKKEDTPKPQVDTAELEKMLARANEYTDGAISNFERRLDKMDKRFNRMAAMSSAQTAMAMNTAGLATYNRLGAGVGYSEGESAMAVGYQRVLNEKGSATFSLNGAFTNSGERSMGVGVGIGW